MWKRGLASSFVIATTLMRSFITHANIFQRLAISTQSRQGPLSLRCCKRLRISTSPLQCTKSSFKEGGRGSRIFNTQLATYASKLKGGQGKSAASAKPGREKEIEVSQRGFTCIIGVDEAGRGPIAGPVVAAACHIPLHVNLEKEKGIILKDSKKLSEKKREEIFEELTSHPQIVCSWAVIPHDRIDEINILQATFEAMDQAVSRLDCTPDYVLVDGNMVPEVWTTSKTATAKMIAKAKETRSSGEASDGPSSDNVPFQSEPIVKGDSTCIAIAAASIVAKVVRDRIMLELDRQYPTYGFRAHKGYPTKKVIDDAQTRIVLEKLFESEIHHLEKLKVSGPSPVHRRSYAPVHRAMHIEVSDGASTGEDG